MAGRLFGRSRHSDPGPVAPSLPGLMTEPHPIDVTLFTADGVGHIQVLAGNGRITELLNAPEPVRVRAKPEPGDADERPWIDVDEAGRDEILAMVPPPRDTNPLQRLHRPAQQVSVRIGPYLITGEAHVPAGSEATGFLMRHQPHFSPLTRARISQPGEPDTTYQVVIVNLRVAEELTNKSLTTPQAAEVPSAEPMAAREPMMPEATAPPAVD
jgi:hypothetical protein